jgi:RNA polymerase sigma factor (sigma-70 family)
VTDNENDLDDLKQMCLSVAHAMERKYWEDQGEFESAALEGAWKALKKYDPSRGMALRPFVHYRVVRSIIDYYRNHVVPQRGGNREGRKTYYCVDFTNPDRESNSHYIQDLYHSGPEPGYANVEVHDALIRVKEQLTPRDWDLLKRRYCEEEPFISIGRVYGITESGAKRAVDKALQRARALVFVPAMA